MKFKNILLFTIAIISIISCEKHNHDNEEEGFEYHAHINAPDSETKHIGQELPINITFESHSGKTIHHINVSIYEKNNESNILYNKPDEAHIHEEDGNYEYSDNLILSEDNGFEGHTDYVIKAKVWAHEAGLDEAEETVSFHVHPE